MNYSSQILLDLIYEEPTVDRGVADRVLFGSEDLTAPLVDVPYGEAGTQVPEVSAVEVNEPEERVAVVNVLIAGDWSDSEFVTLRNLVTDQESEALEVRFATPQELKDWQANRQTEDALQDAVQQAEFDLLLYAQPRQAVTLTELDAFRQLVGESTACVQVLGTWCEGEERNGKVAEGWQRVFWHAFPRWWNCWSESQFEDGSSEVDSAEENSIEGQFETPLPLLEVVADHAMVDALRAALLPEGWRVRRAVPGDSCVGNAGVWVGTQLNGSEADDLARFCDVFREKSAGTVSVTGMATASVVPVVALLDFPRRETIQAAKSVGAADVVALPCDGDDLLDAINRAVELVHREASCREERLLDDELFHEFSEEELPAIDFGNEAELLPCEMEYKVA